MLNVAVVSKERENEVQLTCDLFRAGLLNLELSKDLVTVTHSTTTTTDARTVLASVVVKGKYFFIDKDISVASLGTNPQPTDAGDVAAAATLHFCIVGSTYYLWQQLSIRHAPLRHPPRSQALLSVYNKIDLLHLAKGLADAGVRLLGSGS